MSQLELFANEGHKTCGTCGERKSKEEMWTIKAFRGGETRTYISRQCRKCRAEANARKQRERRASPAGAVKYRNWKKQYRKSNPDKTRKEQRQASLRKCFGIGIAEYEEILSQQGGVCAICGVEESSGKRRLHVDHDHRNGMIRGLLCNGCNTGIGALLENPLIMINAIAYLENATDAVPGRVAKKLNPPTSQSIQRSASVLSKPLPDSRTILINAEVCMSML